MGIHKLSLKNFKHYSLGENKTKAIGFVGSSGTGKSHRAAWVAGERGINFILDDGILINGNTIVAGVSAKREQTKVGSLKRALLTDEVHARDIVDAIKTYEPPMILILGTSVKMVETISRKIGIGKVTEIINIEDVASEFEIKKALDTRKGQGKHVIPVPTFEIRKHFSGRLLDLVPLDIFRKRGTSNYQFIGEKSVVRPTFSYFGKYTISDYTIYQICEYTICKIKGIAKLHRLKVENCIDGVLLEIELIVVYGNEIRPIVNEAQNRAREEVERLTSLNIVAVNVFVKNLVVNTKK